MAVKPSVFIGTPISKQLVHAGYSVSLARIAGTLASAGANITIRQVEGYDVAQQRDQLATEFLQSGASHFLMQDDDLEIEPQAVVDMFNAKKNVAAVICPWRRFDVPKIAQFIGAGHSSAEALELSHTYNVGGVKFPAQGPLFECERIGAGCMLIDRECLTRLMTETNVEEYKTHPDKQIVKQFFHRSKAADGEMQPEDWSFCKRWTAIGGTIWGHGNTNVVHSGYHQHRGNFSTLLKAVAEASAKGKAIA